MYETEFADDSFDDVVSQRPITECLEQFAFKTIATAPKLTLEGEIDDSFVTRGHGNRLVRLR